MDGFVPETEAPNDSRLLVRQRVARPSRNTRSITISPEDERGLDDLRFSSRTTQAPAAQPKAEKPLGLMGTIREGAKGTLRALGATADTMQGDAQGVVKAAQDQAAAPKDPDLEKFYAHIDEQKKLLGENPSLFEGIKAVGSAAINNPRGFGLMVAEQLPNSAAALGAGAAGALAGSFAGPVGTIAGGLAGLAGANIGLETGSKALEAAQDNAFTPEEQQRVRREGLVKGGVITGVDALTLGATNFITGTTRRAVERATTKTLADNGVDITNAAARKAALETPEIADAVKNAQELARKGADKLGKTLARTGGAAALETIGEGAGEYLGELAATGKANAVDAVVEGFAGLGTSIGEIAATSALNRKGLKRLFDNPETAEKTAEDETKRTGVPHEVIKHPTELDKFIAVPKVRSVGGIELTRDEQGNLKPVAPVSTQADFNLANKQGFELSAEDKIRERELKAKEPPRRPIIIPGDTDKAPTIAGKPVTGLPESALIYTVNRGSARAKQIATDEIERRKVANLPVGRPPEDIADSVKRIIATGAEKAQEDGKKAGVILPPSPVPNNAATATKSTQQGANLQVVLPDNTSLPAQWDVVDADSVKAAIKEGKNQPRDRSRAASDIQVQGIANSPDYRRLSDSPVMDVGAPTLSHDGSIVGGNGRFEGLSRAYDQGSAKDYLANLKADAVAKGIDPARIDGMKKPVLVRRITQPFDIRKLAIASNSGTGLQYSSLELAKIDAERMKGLENLEITDSGDIALTGSNVQNIRHSLSGYSAAELGSLVDKDGRLSQEGVRRIRNAMLHAAYGSSPTLERLIESTDNDLRNISGALVKAAGSAAKARADIKAGRLPAELDISEHLVSAVETLSKIKAQGMTVDEYLAQIGLFGEEVNEDTRGILRVLEANIRSQRKIADFIRTYYDAVSHIDTSTGDIFGASIPTKAELLKNAKERITEKQPDTKDLFARPAGDTGTQGSGQPANNASPKDSGKKDQQVSKPETPEPAPRPKPSEESAQDKSHREAGENWAAVNLDIAGSSTKNLERALHYGSLMRSSEQAKAQAGKPYNKNLLEAIKRDLDDIKQELKRREKPAQPAKAPEPKPAEKPKAAKPNKPNLRTTLEEHFRPGNIVRAYSGFDRVLSFNWNNGSWSVTVQRVEKDKDGNWVDKGDQRQHSTIPDERNTIVERAPEPKKQEAAHSLRPLIESLIKRRAAASQTGKDRSLNNAITRAKEVMAGTRTDAALESKWFRAHAAVMRKVDPDTADILSKISETIKGKQNEKAAQTKNAGESVRGNKIPVPRGGRILANGVAEEIQKHGVAALIGKKITSPERLAELAQIYRNPKYETFRMFFTKGDVIVHSSGVTARLPGSTPLFPQGFTDEQKLSWMQDMMRSSGADGYWLMHNHPSGDPTPSPADKRVTDTLATLVPGFKGHIVINSNKYAQIMPRGGAQTSKVVTKQFGEDKLIKASKPHPYLGKIVPNSGVLAVIGKSFQKDGWVTLIGVSGTSGVRAIAEIPTSTFTNRTLARAAIRRFARNTGSESIFAYGSSKDLKAGNAAALVNEGFLRESVDEQGKASGGRSPGPLFGRATGEGGQELNQNSAPFGKAALRDRIEKITDSLIYNFQDRFKPLKDIQKRAGPVAEDEDAALAEERYSGMVRARTDAFEEQMRDPLLKAIHDSKVPYEEVEQYLHALHAPSRNAAMREINPTEAELKTKTEAMEKQRDALAKNQDVKDYIKETRDLRQAIADIEDGLADESLERAIKSELARLKRIPEVKDYQEAIDSLRALRLVKPFKGDNTALSGMSDAESKAILAKIDANGTRKALDKISAIVDSITSKTRQIYIDSGLEKANVIDAWNNKYEHYVPLHRDEVSGNTMPRIGQGFNIRGKESKRATGSTKDVTNILAHVVAQHEAAIIRSEKARVDRTLFQFAKTHPDSSLWTLDNAPMLRTVDPVSGFVVERVDPTYKNRPEVLTLKVDGEEHTITFNEQNQEAMRLAASMKNLSSDQLGEVTQMVGKFTRFLATMSTTANPVFTARNFLRDLQTTFVNLSDTELAAKKREVFRDVPAAIKGMWAMSRGNKTSQWAKYAQEFKNAGGQTGWMEHYRDIGERADTLKKELAAMQPGKANLARRTAKGWWDLVQDANNAVENGARLSAYVNARRSGLSEGKAAQLAKNLTVNFNAHGAKGVELNMWYMFMNASIQGSARLIKAMSNKQVRHIVAGVILAGFLMDIVARSMAGDDDEDGENDYDQLPEHTKAMNFVFMVNNRPVTIPMPYGYNFFASAGRKISEMIFRENYSPVKSAADLAGIFLDAFSPTGQAGSLLQYAAPTVADPFIQYAENKNFAGNPIRKPQNPFGVPNPEYQMGFKSTSAPAKWLAEALNDSTGGNEVRPGFVNVNPAFFDFAVSSIAGGAGRTYLQAVSGPVKLAKDDEVQAREIPFVNIFVGAKPEHQTERKYFEAVGKVELAAKELKTYRQKGDTEMVKQIQADHREELKLAEAAKTTKTILNRLRKNELALDKTDPPNKQELKKAIEEKKKEAMSRFNKRYREAVAVE